MTNSSFINPASLSLPSPSSTPGPTSPSDNHAAGPSRKRARTETAQEDRKEARAHRNRIAAQNSRDRRKAQFTFLERRVAELEEENRQLRAGMGIPDRPRPDARRAEELEREKTRERENEELRERIKTLEQGWDTVVKALAAQRVSIGLPTPPVSSVPSPEDNAPSGVPPQPPTSTFPVLVPTPPTIFPPSPSLSHTSLSGSDLFSEEFEFESTRHLARVATIEAPPPSMSLQRFRFDLGAHTPETRHDTTPTTAATQTPPTVDDTTMEDLFREILAPSPTTPTTSLPLCPHALLQKITPLSSVASAAPTMTNTGTPVPMDWASEVEMQRILNMLPNVNSDVGVDFSSTLDLDLGGWDFENMSGSVNGIGVF